MLDQRHIKKLAKPYTDTQLLNNTDKAYVDDQVWSNGVIMVIGEPPVKFTNDYRVEKTASPDDLYMRMLECWTDGTVPAWPVFIGQASPLDSYDLEPVVLFKNHSREALCNGRYVSAMLRQVKRGQDAGWSLGKNAKDIPVLFLEVDGEPVAALAALADVKTDPSDPDGWDWNLSNYDIPEEFEQ